MKIGVVSLGCCKNLVDSERMMGLLRQSGHEIVSDVHEAEAIIVNTCGFIEPAKEEAINTILEMAEYKNENCRKLIVAGCLAQRYKADLEAEMPEVDCFLTISDYPKMGQILTRGLGRKGAGWLWKKHPVGFDQAVDSLSENRRGLRQPLLLLCNSRNPGRLCFFSD